MPSSTSASETAFARGALGAFVCALIVLLAPCEALVRAAEHRWGVHPARIAPRRTGVPHIDMFLEDVAAGVHYRVIAVGTSRVENGIAPEAMDSIVGRTYNLGLGLGSSVPMMEFLESQGIRPEHLLVGVSPMDFTMRGVLHGRGEIARRNVAPVVVPEALPTRWTRSAVFALLHSATPERHRNLGKWLQLRSDGGEVLAFLNNEDATEKPDVRQTHGFYPMTRVIEEWGYLHGGQRDTVLADYREQHEEAAVLFIDLVRRFRAHGVDVVLVRLPTTPAMRHSEEGGTSFASDIAAVARACGALYVDGAAIAPPALVATRTNFADNEHMNETGAMQFSRALAERLRRSR